MKRLTLATLLTVSITALILTYVVVGSSQIQPQPQSQRRMAIEAVVSPKIPLNLGSTTATMVDKQTVLQYEVTNRAGGQMAVIDALAVIVDKTGRIKGGEGWTVSSSLLPNSAESFVHIMKTQLEVED